MGITERKVVNTSSNLDNTIFLNTTLFCISNLQSARIKTFGIHKTLTTRLSSRDIFESIVDGGVNLVVLVNIFMLSIRRAKNFHVGLFSRISYLRNSTTINLITFSLKNRQCLIELLFRNIKVTFNAFTNVNHATFINTILQVFSSLLCLIHTRFCGFVKKRANRRIILKSHLLSNFIQRISIFSKTSSLFNKQCSSLILSDAIISSQISSSDFKIISNLFFSHALFFKFSNTTKEITTMLIGVFARTPRITTGMSRRSIVH